MGIGTLHHSYMLTCRCKQECVDFVALVGPEYTVEEKNNLTSLGIKVITVPLLSQPNCTERRRWTGALTKFHIFNLTEYDHVIYIDPDVIILRPLSSLFQVPPWQVCSESRKDKCAPLHTGVMVIRPRRDIFHALLRDMALLPCANQCADQGLLHDILVKNEDTLKCTPSIGQLVGPWTFQLKVRFHDDVIPGFNSSVPDNASAALERVLKVYRRRHPMLHFVNAKPWDHDRKYVGAETLWWMAAAGAMHPSSEEAAGNGWLSRSLQTAWARWSLATLQKREVRRAMSSVSWAAFASPRFRDCNF